MYTNWYDATQVLQFLWTSYFQMSTTSDVAKEDDEESPKNKAKNTNNSQKGTLPIEQNQSLTKDFT